MNSPVFASGVIPIPKRITASAGKLSLCPRLAELLEYMNAIKSLSTCSETVRTGHQKPREVLHRTSGGLAPSCCSLPARALLPLGFAKLRPIFWMALCLRASSSLRDFSRDFVIPLQGDIFVHTHEDNLCSLLLHLWMASLVSLSSSILFTWLVDLGGCSLTDGNSWPLD